MACSVLLVAFLAVSTVLAQAAETYTVRKGDTLFRIATRYGVTVTDLKRWNGLKDNAIRVGQHLRVSPPEPPQELPQESPPESPQESPPEPLPEPPVVGAAGDSLARYTVQPGDTYYSLGQRFGLPADTLLALNGGGMAPLEPGQQIRLPARFATTPYRVRRGDTLHRIAARHGVTVAALQRTNRLRDDRIAVGQVLQVPSTAVAQRPAGALPEVWGRGKVVVYPPTFAGRLTAGGMLYDPARFTVSHRDLPFGTLVLLTNPATGRSTFAEVTDRGPLQAGYIMDVSAAVAQVLGLTGEADVEVRLVP